MLDVKRLVRRTRLLPDSARSLRPPTFDHPISQLASSAQMRDGRYAYWRDLLGESRTGLNRKVWEWAYALEVMEQYGVLRDGMRALGFGCGQEPLPAVLAARGVMVTATDQAPETAGDWASTNQHSSSLASFRRPDLCNDALLEERVQFRAVDMREIPSDLAEYDVVWSSCALEHLGSLQAGLDFVLASVDCLRPGGIAVHTTEFDLDDHDPAVDLGAVVLYRRRDIEALALALRHRGHGIKCNFHVPQEAADLHVDDPPYSEVHVRLRVGPAQSTSFGLLIEKRCAQGAQWRRWIPR